VIEEKPAPETPDVSGLYKDVLDGGGAALKLSAEHGLNKDRERLEMAIHYAVAWGCEINKVYKIMSDYESMQWPAGTKRVCLVYDNYEGDAKIMFVMHKDTVQDVLDRWARICTMEYHAFKLYMMDLRSTLYNEKGMSTGKSIRAMAEIPPNVLALVKEVDPDFWTDKEKVRRFLVENPMFQVGRMQG
jgi:hypothetical protein